MGFFIFSLTSLIIYGIIKQKIIMRRKIVEKLIRLITVQDVSDFVKTVSEKCKHTVLAKQGIYTVNASSILGMYSLDLMKYFTIEADPEDAKNFQRWEIIMHGD